MRPRPVLAPTGGGQCAGVRAGAILRDRIASRAFAPVAGVQVADPLLPIAVGQDVVRARDVRPQSACDLAQLFMDEDLLHDGPALATELDRQRATVQSGLDGRPADGVAPVARDTAVRTLELGPERLEDVTDEGSSAGLEFELGGREGQIPAGRMDHPVTGSWVSSRAPGRRQGTGGGGE